ncbi:SIMPL domain-containing protein [Nocardioides gansuensis]|uniref:SIMPL domain-containing protein n=1 Tax=Nocardioides gansuensis TaxID=2138300 RepID=A0A2T8FD82_9ACTN|nr:SIMPL domain-containing protein [Nocardioides gansuensis]PVG83667.1 SIMPL domain-containing protein [Nocardioides gansuensis]
MAVDITVRGSFRAFRKPERAVVHLVVGLEGADAAHVYHGVTGQVATVTALVRELHDPEHGPVTWWASDQLRTWASRPWNQDGKQLPLVHHAHVDLQVKFAEFGALGSWLGKLAEIEGANVRQIEWALTDVHRRQLVREVRAAAVKDAQERAQAYADALGLGPVRLASLADAGMLAPGLHPVGGEEMAMARAMAPGDSGVPISFAPEDVSVTADVDARFTAGDPTMGS